MKVIQLFYPHEGKELPKEDAWSFDEKNFVFAVADGVTLVEGIEFRGKYPLPSPAGALAQEFCDAFVKTASQYTITKAFSIANKSIFHFNQNRDKANTFSKAEAYYAATASFGMIKGNILEWGYICDASVSVIDKDDRLVFSHNDHKHYNDFDHLLYKYSFIDVMYMLRTIFRNATSEKGDKIGYGVVTGENETEAYVIFGKHILQPGQTVVFATDGFETYLQDSEFIKYLSMMDKISIEKRMAELKKQYGMKHEYTAERTLIAVKY